MNPGEPLVPTRLADMAAAPSAASTQGEQVDAAARTPASTCWCDRRSQGTVGADGDVPAHACHECSPEHCWHAREARRCKFGACTLGAVAELIGHLSVDGQPLKVCTLHVGPALTWGRDEPISRLELRWFDDAQSAAA